MNFRSENDFNVLANALSGNFFPLIEEKQKINLFVIMYAIFSWLIQFAHMATWWIGSINYEPLLKAAQEACVLCISFVELIILAVYLNLRRQDLRDLIRKVNAILIDSDDFKRCMRNYVEPNNKYLKFYTIASVSGACSWTVAPIFKVFKQNRFTYWDYTLTAYLPGEPFNVGTFIAGVLLQTISIFFMSFKKISIDIYLSYFVTLLTSEYRYVREQIAVALHQENDNEKDEILVIAELQKCVQHHCAIIEYVKHIDNCPERNCP